MGWHPWGGTNAAHLLGTYVEIQGVRKYNATCHTDNDGSDSKLGITLAGGYWTSSELGNSTSHTYTFGRSSRDGSAQTAPQYLNPQNTSGRHRQNTSNILILEVSNLGVST